MLQENFNFTAFSKIILYRIKTIDRIYIFQQLNKVPLKFEYQLYENFLARSQNSTRVPYLTTIFSFYLDFQALTKAYVPQYTILKLIPLRLFLNIQNLTL